ncbi:hypothetical protein PFICI_06062 [Pestalotiopsis fici W106-1]|uniref:F-box domain-containing protein n=1 Tax=Pestalotiopsis fici (strain W106-1 / CGMCC3.15140) TaxID=1229662 RepID=W3X4S5_PESFW|nr:uncharacterized protein PFICI_06062 [Pestalotiopsis fici W106-1]ETS81060.1 hypothetical protein PFICI_06062 [Pestalotiopsis fici W106-1]
MSISFDDLPGEVHELIFRSLDPVTLISFGQTNRQFRAVIKATKELLAERLLVLECQEEFGGPVFHFDGRDNSQNPAWDHEQIDQIRWACTHCLKLLHHRNFDNHSLLRLCFRKPLPDWPAAQPVTSWEPMGKVASRAVLKSRVAAYRDSLHWGRTEFANGDNERYVCGYRRRHRRCNECRYQIGDLRSHIVIPPDGIGLEPYLAGANLGTATVPIVKSRRLFFNSSIHRYFPDLFTDLPCYSTLADKAPTFPIHRQDARDRAFTHYMVRCPGCATWKEFAAFRGGSHWPKWWPAHQHRWGTSWENWDGRNVDRSFIEGLRCHSCYAAVHGRQALMTVLIEWYTYFLLGELHFLLPKFAMGWSCLYRATMDGPDVHTWYHVPARYKFDVLTEVMAGIPWEDPDDKREGIENVMLADRETLRTMNEKHKILKKHWGTWFVPNPQEHTLPDEFNDWIISWVDGYDSLEAKLLWLRGCREELLKRPSAILEWALNDKTAGDGLDIDAKAMWKNMAKTLSEMWGQPEIALL